MAKDAKNKAIAIDARAQYYNEQIEMYEEVEKNLLDFLASL